MEGKRGPTLPNSHLGQAWLTRLQGQPGHQTCRGAGFRNNVKHPLDQTVLVPGSASNPELMKNAPSLIDRPVKHAAKQGAPAKDP